MQKKKDKRKREEESAEKKKKKVGRLNDCGCVCLYQPQRFVGLHLLHPSPTFLQQKKKDKGSD